VLPGRAAADDLAGTEVDDRIRRLAEIVVEGDRAARAGEEHRLAAARGEHLRRGGVEDDPVREAERVAGVREVDPRVIDAVGRHGSGARAAVPDEALGTADGHAKARSDRGHLVAAGVHDRHRHAVGVAQPDTDSRLVRRAVADRGQDLRDERPVDLALDELQVLGDGKGGSGGHQQAKEGDRRENPLQSPSILRRSG
jgi:hypothetical protein